MEIIVRHHKPSLAQRKQELSTSLRFLRQRKLGEWGGLWFQASQTDSQRGAHGGRDDDGGKSNAIVRCGFRNKKEVEGNGRGEGSRWVPTE